MAKSESIWRFAIIFWRFVPEPDEFVINYLLSKSTEEEELADENDTNYLQSFYSFTLFKQKDGMKYEFVQGECVRITFTIEYPSI